MDKLCEDIYGEQHGISCYIEDMKASMSDNSDYRNIPSWTSDYQQLVRFRHIRNHLAHAEGAFHEKNCTQEDIAQIQDFYERILSRTDALALLYKYSKMKQKASKNTSTAYDVPYNEVKQKASKNRNTTYDVLYDVKNTYQKNKSVEEKDEWADSYWIISIGCSLGLIIAAIVIILYIYVNIV